MTLVTQGQGKRVLRHVYNDRSKERPLHPCGVTRCDKTQCFQRQHYDSMIDLHRLNRDTRAFVYAGCHDNV